jgi:hypothetical protein
VVGAIDKKCIESSTFGDREMNVCPVKELTDKAKAREAAKWIVDQTHANPTKYFQALLSSTLAGRICLMWMNIYDECIILGLYILCGALHMNIFVAYLRTGSLYYCGVPHYMVYQCIFKLITHKFAFHDSPRW